MTRSWLPLHDTPGHSHGVVDESDHESRMPVGSTSMAAFRASKERPSELSVRETETQSRRMITRMWTWWW